MRIAAHIVEHLLRSGKRRLGRDCSGTIDARFCAWRTPGGVKSVNLCELSVPGTEARCRPSHYRLSDDPQLRTGARKNCTIDDAALTWACPPPAPAPNCFAGRVKSVNLCELSVPGTEARCHRDEGGARANHGSARCSRAGATAGGRTEMRNPSLLCRTPREGP